MFCWIKILRQMMIESGKGIAEIGEQFSAFMGGDEEMDRP